MIIGMPPIVMMVMRIEGIIAWPIWIPIATTITYSPAYRIPATIIIWTIP
jgi:hypothetical protein